MQKERESNLEFLRNLAMFFVLLVHSMYLSLGAPSLEYINSNPLDAYTRVFLECLSIVSVNLFILISGWFGINLKLIRIVGLIFQCIFIYSFLYIIALILGYRELSLTHLKEVLLLKDVAWFIPSYLGLYILSPVLNSFVKNATKKEFENFLIMFFSFEFIYGFVITIPKLFVLGYHTLSFIGLYLLARYIKIYQPKFANLNKFIDLFIYFCVVFLAFIMINLTKDYALDSKFLYYSSLNVIIASLFLFLFFTKLKFQNKLINLSAISCFAVYLVHQNPIVGDGFCMAIRYLHQNFSSYFYIVNFLFLIALFFASILLDKLRIVVWNSLIKIFN